MDTSTKLSLRLTSIITPDMDIENVDFTLYSELTKESAAYVKGRKVSAAYTRNGEVYVMKRYEDILENGVLAKLKMYIDFYNYDGNVAYTKEQIVKKYNTTEAEEETEKRRRRQVRYTKAKAKQNPAFAPYIDILFDSYAAVIEKFAWSGATDFKDAMINETDATLRQILDTPFDPNTGATVMQALIGEFYL